MNEYTNCNLQGKSFKNRKDLAGVNFAGSDLRGVNFENADLSGADFSNVQCGVTRIWTYFFLLIFLLQLVASSIPIAIAGWWLTFFILPQTTEKYNIVPLVVVVSIISILIYLIIFRKEEKTPYLAAIGAFAIAIATGLAVSDNMQIAVGLGISVLSAVIGVGTSLVGAAAIIGAYLLGKRKFTIDRNRKKTLRQGSGLYIFVLILISAVIAGLLCAKATSAVNGATPVGVGLIIVNAGYGWHSMIFSATASITSVILSGIVAYRIIAKQYYEETVEARKKDVLTERNDEENFNWIRDFAVYMVSIKGTRFNKADLSDAVFTSAKLENSNLLGAIIIRTRWKDVENLMWTRNTDSYLANPSIRNLVVSLNGEGKHFEKLSNLHGLNLKGANLINSFFNFSDLKESNFENAALMGADFTESVLIQANFKGANLKEALLINSQLDQADFSGADLTGACIEHWNITKNTNFEKVKCDFIYRAGGDKQKKDQHKYPNFKDKFDENEFAEFIIPPLSEKFFDVYVSENANLDVMAMAYHALKNESPEAELEWRGMEKRGVSGLLIKLAATPEADKSKLTQGFHETYENIKQLPTAKRKQLAIGEELLFDSISEVNGREENPAT